MTTKEQTLSIYTLSRWGADHLEDLDLVRMAEQYPEMQPVLEEVQHLRAKETSRLRRY